MDFRAGRARATGKLKSTPGASKQANLGETSMAFVIDTVPANRGVIDMSNPREIAWWTKRFACNEQQLRDAVEQVGTNAAQVEQLLDGQEFILTV